MITTPSAEVLTEVERVWALWVLPTRGLKDLPHAERDAETARLKAARPGIAWDKLSWEQRMLEKWNPSDGSEDPCEAAERYWREKEARNRC